MAADANRYDAPKTEMIARALLDMHSELAQRSETAPSSHGMLAAQLRGVADHLRAVPEYHKLRGDADIIDNARKVLESLPTETRPTGAFCPVDAEGCKETPICPWPCKRLKP